MCSLNIFLSPADAIKRLHATETCLDKVTGDLINVFLETKLAVF